MESPQQTNLSKKQQKLQENEQQNTLLRIQLLKSFGINS